MNEQSIPEIRVRKGSEAASITGSAEEPASACAQQQTALVSAPLAQSEALSDIEDIDMESDSPTGVTSPEIEGVEGGYQALEEMEGGSGAEDEDFPPPPPPEELEEQRECITSPIQIITSPVPDVTSPEQDINSQGGDVTSPGEDVTSPYDVISPIQDITSPIRDSITSPDSSKDSPPPRPPSSPSLAAMSRSRSPARPSASPALHRAPSPARPDRPPSPNTRARDRSPARPAPPNMRPPTPKLIVTDNEGNERKTPARPPPPKSPTAEGVLIGTFDQDESELVALHQDNIDADGHMQTYERPRSITPIKTVSLSEYTGGATEASAEESEKIKVTLPKEEFSKRSKGPRKTPQEANESWMTFQDQMSSQVKSLSMDEEDPINDSEAVKAGPPKRPAPPAPAKPAGKPTWETFGDLDDDDDDDDDDDSTPVAPVRKPHRPPPPCRPPPPQHASATEAEDPFSLQPPKHEDIADESFDDDTELAPVEKTKRKKRGLSPRRIKGFVGEITGKKKDKKKKKNKGVDDLELMAAVDVKMGETKSQNFQMFEEMQNRIQSTLQATQENVTKTGEKIDTTLNEMKTTSAVNSPWTIMGSPSVDNITSPESTQGVPKEGWVGFEDSFSASHITASPHLAHLEVTPSASPKHTPVPPNNSRRASEDGNKEVVDLLGMGGETTTEVGNEDLLGLDGPTGDTTDSGKGSLTGDILALSRNPQLDESQQSSGISTPVHFDADILALAGGDTVENENTKKEPSVPIVDNFIDDFLGITKNEPKRDESATLDDDFFGFGKCKSPTPAVAHAGDDLMGGMVSHVDLEDDDDDPFAVPEAAKVITAGGAASEFLEKRASMDQANDDPFGFGPAPEKPKSRSNSKSDVKAVPSSKDDVKSVPRPQSGVRKGSTGTSFAPRPRPKKGSTAGVDLMGGGSFDKGNERTPIKASSIDKKDVAADIFGIASTTQPSIEKSYGLDFFGDSSVMEAPPLGTKGEEIFGTSTTDTNSVTATPPLATTGNDLFGISSSDLDKPDAVTDLFGAPSATSDEVTNDTAPSGAATTKTPSVDKKDESDIFGAAASDIKEETTFNDEADFDFDPRAFDDDGDDSNINVKPLEVCPEDVWGDTGGADASTVDNPFAEDLFACKPSEFQEDNDEEPQDEATTASAMNPFAESNPMNPFASEAESTTEAVIDEFSIFGTVEDEPALGNSFNPFATISDDHGDVASVDADGFDPFQTIQGDDAFVEDTEPAADKTETTTHAESHHSHKGNIFVDIQQLPRKTGLGAAIVPFLPPPPSKADLEVSTSSSEEEPEPEPVPKPPTSTNPFSTDTDIPQKIEDLEPTVTTEEAPKPEEVKSPTAAPKSPGGESSGSSFALTDEEFSPIEDFLPDVECDGWKLLVRYPMKKKLSTIGNRYWKPVFVRIGYNKGVPCIRIYNDDVTKNPFHELQLQASYQMCNMGLQTFDQFGKCHTVKIQYVFYRERVAVKADRIAPTISDLTRVRDLKGLKDLVHKPKTTMILDHAPQNSELMKLGGLNYEEFKTFVRELENAFFHLKAYREKPLTYTKDEISMDMMDEYFVDMDKDGHILSHKARVRVFCLAFLTAMPKCELGLNDRRRKGKEVVGRHDIIPIKTEEWVRVEEPEFHCCVDAASYDRAKPVKFNPLDACQFELMRFRVRPTLNKELPLQIKANMTVTDKRITYKSEILIPGFYTNSKKKGQTPCEDISVRFPIPQPWIYLFRVEKRFKYGSIKSATRKPGKIKGLERLTMIAQGVLPPSLIEVSSGGAKYENIFQSVVWRIPRLPERNEGAYKTHMFKMTLDLGPHDVIPEDYDRHIHVEFHQPNSTVSRAQIRSISVTTEEPPDKWVNHLAKYQYLVEMSFGDPVAEPSPDLRSPVSGPDSPVPDSDHEHSPIEPGPDSDTSSDED